MEKFITLEEAANIIRHSPAYIRNNLRYDGGNLADFRGLRFFRLGRRWLTTTADIAAAIPSIPPAPASITTPAPAQPRRGPGRPRKAAGGAV